MVVRDGRPSLASPNNSLSVSVPTVIKVSEPEMMPTDTWLEKIDINAKRLRSEDTHLSRMLKIYHRYYFMGAI